MTTTIRPAEAKDQSRWLELFTAYSRFYRAELSTEISSSTWGRILDANSNIEALLAEVDGEVIGIANYLFHLSTWSERPNCYLEDLYVDPAIRGSGAARRLIEGAEEAARARNAFRLYWHTQEYNAPARSLYDTITPRSSFIVYRKGL